MRIPIALACIAMLSTCSRPMQLADHAFDVPAPDAWQGGELAESAPTAEWWTYFQDDRLDKSIRAALACNRSLKAAAARVEAAQEQLLIAGAGKLPTVDVGVNRLQQRQNFVGLPFRDSRTACSAIPSLAPGYRSMSRGKPTSGIGSARKCSPVAPRLVVAPPTSKPRLFR